MPAGGRIEIKKKIFLKICTLLKKFQYLQFLQFEVDNELRDRKLSAEFSNEKSCNFLQFVAIGLVWCAENCKKL